MPTKTESAPESEIQVVDRLRGLYQQRATLDDEIFRNLRLLDPSLGRQESSASAKVAEPENHHHNGNGKSAAATKPAPAKAAKSSAKKPRAKWIPAEPATVENGVQIFDKLGKGRKECPNEGCKRIINSRAEVCVCGYNFKKQKQGAAPEPSKPDDERVQELLEPTLRVVRQSKKPMDLPDVTGRLLSQGIKVVDSKDVEKALKQHVSDKNVKYHDKDMTWEKVAS